MRTKRRGRLLRLPAIDLNARCSGPRFGRRALTPAVTHSRGRSPEGTPSQGRRHRSACEHDDNTITPHHHGPWDTGSASAKTAEHPSGHWWLERQSHIQVQVSLLASWRRRRKDQVDAIVKRFAEGKNDEPPIEIITNPVVLEHNVPTVPDKVFELLAGLPTYLVPGRIYRTQVARRHTFGPLLAGDHVVEDALSQIRIHLNGVLKTQRQRLERDGSFAKALTRVRSLKIERSYALLAADSLDDLPDEVLYEIDRDDNKIEDLFKVAKRKLPEGVAQYYWNDVISTQSDEDYDPIEAKAETAVLAPHPEVIEAVESAAEQLVRTWFRERQVSISKLSDAKKAAYEPVWRETRKPELTGLILGNSKTVRDSDDRWEEHVLADDSGEYPFKPGGWERTVLKAELRDNDLVAWYRNPIGTSGALRIPYKGPDHDKSKYPDFIMFHQTDECIKPSIIDPHGPFLTGSAEQLRGLAEYAADFGDQFERIESVAKVGDKMLLST